MITFSIPVRPSTPNAAGTSASSVLNGGRIDPSDAVVGVPMPPEATEILKKFFAKDGDTYTVSDVQAAATKRALLAWWGFPESFVKTKYDLLKLDPVSKGSESTVDENNRVTGNIGGVRLEGSVIKNDDWTKSSIAEIINSLAPPKAATSLSLHESFFTRLGVSDASARAAVNERLFAALSHWTTISDKEVAWAKTTILTGLGISGELSLEARAEGGSALAEDHGIQGVLKTAESGKTSVISFRCGFAVGCVVESAGFGEYQVFDEVNSFIIRIKGVRLHRQGAFAVTDCPRFRISGQPRSPRS